MSDPPRNALQSMFREDNRYANFGNILMRLHIQGFRCHSNTIVDIASPITAFCGLNGTGKSTILQLAAAAYKSPGPNIQHYYIKDFVVVGALDPHPFTDEAAIEYRYWQNDRSLRPLTLSRNTTTKRWQGYQRRPERQVFFAGVGLYLPKIEQFDFTVRNASRLTISNSNAITDRIKEWTCKIPGCSYEEMIAHTVMYQHRTAKVTSVRRTHATYSEAHMGYGEGRSQYLIASLETLSEKSLVLIEEPETSLHPSAQYELGRYLVDVVKRRRHQIFLTTHSEFVLEALPSQSRVYLNRTEQGIEPILGMTALQAKSLMAQGHVKALHVLVEDDCAQAILRELLRRFDPSFLRSIGIYPIGGANIVATTVRALQSTGLPVAAVCDGDIPASPSENIFTLPGPLPPERELFANAAVREHILSVYGVNLDDFSASLSGIDHHYWFERLASHINQDRTVLVTEAARAYAHDLLASNGVTLVKLLKEASRQ